MASSSSSEESGSSQGSAIISIRVMIAEQEKDKIFGDAMKLVNGSVLPMAMNAAIQLGVFDILAKADDGALFPEEIAAQMLTDNPNAPAMLERICDLLSIHGVLRISGGRHFEKAYTYSGVQRYPYCLSPVSKYFVRNEDGVSLAPLMALVQDKVFFNSWSQLKDAVLEGGVPFNKFHGMNLYEYLGQDARFSQVFKTAMFNHTHMFVKEIIDSYEAFKNLNQVVDVGGGTGVTLGLITSKYPKIKGINFDLPYVIQHAHTFPGVKHEAGDMFESVPKGEAILLKEILQYWSDDCCLKLLKNCYNALPKNGKLIVVERKYGKSQIDVLTMTLNAGGKERLEHEISGLATRAGFKDVDFARSVLNTWVMEFKK